MRVHSKPSPSVSTGSGGKTLKKAYAGDLSDGSTAEFLRAAGNVAGVKVTLARSGIALEGTSDALKRFAAQLKKGNGTGTHFTLSRGRLHAHVNDSREAHYHQQVRMGILRGSD